MALGGGTFLTQNKILPGSYINFVSLPRALGTLSDRGTIALALELNWGPEDQVITLENTDFEKESLSILGYSYTDPEMLYLREIFRGAKTAKLYRLNSGGKKATLTVGNLTATARYSGTRGNDLKIVINKNIDDATKYDVITYIDRIEVDSQAIEKIDELMPNPYILFTGSGNPTETLETAGSALTGGENQVVKGESGVDIGEYHAKCLDKLES